MLNKKDTISYLQALNLTREEAKIYLELLKGPSTHLELARATGINRTKVYRISDQLEKRSIITTRTDDKGTQLAAADPDTLEVEIVTKEEAIKNQRAILRQILPGLQAIKNKVSNSNSFIVQTYEGIEGFKQMLWHELKAEKEVLIFGSGTIESLVTSKRWAEKYRATAAAAGYNVRELLNFNKKDDHFTDNSDYLSHYQKRYLHENTLMLDNQVVIYNNTVSTFSWRDEQKVGVEVINEANATMMRQMFELYWQQAHATVVK